MRKRICALLLCLMGVVLCACTAGNRGASVEMCIRDSFPHALLAACQTHRRMRCWALACRALCGSARGCVGAVSFSRPDGGIAARQSATWAPAIPVLRALALCL